MLPTSGTSSTVPTRPGLAIFQSPTSTSLRNPDSGSSNGGQTSGSLPLLPPGAQLPNPPPHSPFPPEGVPIRPPLPRRLSRPSSQKPLPEIPKQPPRPLGVDTKLPALPPPPPSSWAVHFRGFVKAVKWSKSNPQLNKTTRKNENSCERPENAGLPSRVSVRNGQQAASSPASNQKSPVRARPVGPASSSSLGEKSRFPNDTSAKARGVFLVPRPPANTQHDFHPPTPGWMFPVPVDRHGMTEVRTVVRHSSDSRQFHDGAVQANVSPPRADINLRKSVSDVGHGSVLYAPLSPATSSSSLEQLPDLPVDSADASREPFPRIPPFSEKESPEPPPVPPKGRFSLIRALSFKGGAHHKSTSEFVPAIDGGPLLSRQSFNSVDGGLPEFAIVSPVVDKNGRRRLRRHSTLMINSRSVSSFASRGRHPPKFMLSPDASESSVLSMPPIVAHSPSPVATTGLSTPTGRRRLTKRRPSEETKSLLSTTIEVETPALEVNDPVTSMSFPLPSPSSHPEQKSMLPTSDTPGSPLSVPPTGGLGNTSSHSVVASANVKTRASSTPSIPLLSVPPPPVSPLPTPSTSSPSYEGWAPPHTKQAENTSNAPPSAMRALRPAMPHRPPLERRASRRRWTLDLASEDIGEDALKAELERLRLLGEPIGGSQLSSVDSSWTLARKVLLSSREVILTEHTYLNQMSRFMTDSVHDASTPSLLAKHLPLLISASQAFCNRLVEDPSAWGVSAAFVTVESVLEQVFVDYCGVVGQIMLACQQQSAGQKTPPSAHSRFPSMSKSRTSIANGANDPGKIPTPRKSSEKDDREKPSQVSGGHSVDDSLNGSAGHGVPRTRSVSGKSKIRRISLSAATSSSAPSIAPVPIPNHAGSNSSTHLATNPGPSPTDKRHNGNLADGRAKAITAADIAIAPPQRVTRYVMLYRDLLNGTPLTAPSRPLVQRALDGALRIAESCNRAQNFMNRNP